jgi:hypothetical protein
MMTMFHQSNYGRLFLSFLQKIIWRYCRYICRKPLLQIVFSQKLANPSADRMFSDLFKWRGKNLDISEVWILFFKDRIYLKYVSSSRLPG